VQPSRIGAGFLLGVAVTLGGLLAYQSLLQPPPAYAQIPDSGAQRERMIRELVTVNQRLTEIVATLKDIRALQRRALAKQARPTASKP